MKLLVALVLNQAPPGSQASSRGEAKDSALLSSPPGTNTGVGCHFLLQGIFPTQGSHPGLPHCRWILYLENPRDGGAWWAAVYGVTQSRTRLKRLSKNPRDGGAWWAAVHGVFQARVLEWGAIAFSIKRAHRLAR